jgi:hypothetical protein
MATTGMMLIPNFIKLGQMIRKLKRGHKDTYIQRQHDDLVRKFFLFQKEKQVNNEKKMLL